MKYSTTNSDWFADKQSLIFMVGGALLVILLAFNFFGYDSSESARILRISGPVVIERQGEKITPSVGMLLNGQDKVLTGTGSYVEVAYDENLKNVVRIEADSKVVLESAKIQKQTTLFMDKGEIKLKLDRLEKGSTFKVRTPVAIAGVRGTAFGVKFMGKELLITDYESRIFVKGLTEDFVEMKDELLLNDGWKVQVAQFEKPSRVERMTASEHDAWQTWLNEINALPQSTVVNNGSYSNFAQNKGSLIQTSLTQLSAVITRMTSSASTVAIVLFTFLIFGTGKVVEKVWA
ncbi:MAG: FecR domain-containing protein [Candidatus Omnitrophica bacterium]|nr:FecR domain-containing protein [Candidatus Omnitrophota bacterium]